MMILSQAISRVYSFSISLLLPVVGVLLTLVIAIAVYAAQEDFRVLPYLQNPASNGMTIIWFSNDSAPGVVRFSLEGSAKTTTVTTKPVLAEALAYSDWESETFFGGQAPNPQYRHRVRLIDLQPASSYVYTVTQGATEFSAIFRTTPNPDDSVRIIVFGDCETEPESTGKHAKWVEPASGESRSYLLDQTVGYTNNLQVIAVQNPDLVVIAGDLVEAGGEQRDWDEFWRHLVRTDNPPGLASRVPLIAALGNHEYYEGDQLDGYDQPGSERAINRFRTYFEFPTNNSPNVEQEGRYYRLDFGPVTLIVLDVANNSPHRSYGDTNFLLLGENDAGGGRAPSFAPYSQQYTWLDTQLREAQSTSQFTFVIFHHVPYSVGPHGWPPGEGERLDAQSGVPVRSLTPLFMRYGVDAVFAGHDEIWERSEVMGVEIKPDSSERPHRIHFYDVGTGGDGLRGPEHGLNNPNQEFLAHRDAPEIWQNGVLVDGGKHYGHLQVDVKPLADSSWQAVLEPVYVFPIFQNDTTYSGYERRLYDDIVTLTSDFTTAMKVED